MHIAVLSDQEDSGGANIAARRLTDAFAAAGHQITRIYQQADTSDQRWSTRLIPSLLATHELPLVMRAAHRLVPRSVQVDRHQRHAEVVLASILDEVRPDVVSVHNLHISTWSPEMIRTAARRVPTVCTLHDTWTFTGRCVFPAACEKYVTGCDDRCPTANEYPALAPEKINAAWGLRREILTEGKVAAVAPSEWLARVAATGLWRTQQVFTIPNPTDLQAFSPVDRDTAKQMLGINPDARVVLACASDLASPRKGVAMLLEALRTVVARPVHLVLLGQPIAVPSLPHVEVHQLGFVASDRLRAVVFNSGDVFVHPAIADNAPLTVVESLACGTPVVAFPVDGLPETILAGRTGWLAREVSSTSLGETLVTALDAIDRGTTLRSECREFAVNRYTPADVVAQYESVFRHVVHGLPTSVPVVER